jgi:hypothetical protein
VGLSLGAAFATKFAAGPGVLGLGVAAVARAPRGGRARAAALLLAPIALAFLPFAVRNFVDTGDPIYPAGRGLLRLPIPGVSAESLRYATSVNADVPGGVAWGRSAARGREDEIVGWHHFLGLFALLFAARRRGTRFLLPLVLCYLVLAAVYHPPARYLIPAWMALSVFEGIAAAWLLTRRLGLLGIAVVLPAALDSGRFALTQFAPFRYLSGREDRSSFLARVLPGHRAAELVNRLPPGGRVMALDFPSPVYFDRPWIVEGILNEPPLRLWLRETPSADRLLARLQALDVRYLVVTPGFGGGTPLSLLRVADSPDKAMPLLELRRRLSVAGSVDGVDVYEIPRAAAPAEYR